ncbi:MAG: hypothetical protein IT529_02845 [Burkholderiales bacterium]|nr:hypothetical protein [Burkholderiales bacterium]
MTVARAVGALLALAVVAGGCAGVPPAGRPPAGEASRGPEPHNLTGFSPAFREGYVAGCGSAKSGEQRRDGARYTGEPDYAMGWDDGYSICARRK